MTYQASWRHERIFRRPEREDRRSARTRDGQEPSRPHLLRLALLRQTLRQTRRGGSLASPQEETRLKTQARRASQQAARRGPQGAPFHHSARGGWLLGGVAFWEVSRSTMCRAIKRMNATRKKGVD